MQSQHLEIKISELEKKLAVKNRELEIEAALEKVRTKAMGMRAPADMLDVCKTISLQLKSLGVKEIRNVQTAIFYEHLGTYMNYEYYARHKKTIITETSYTNHEIHKEFAAKMLKGRGEFFVTHIKGKKVKEWIAYQKTTNVFIDKYLETASSLNYYWFSLGPVALGISTYHPLTEEEINLFKRFLKVFELAYRRYLDIEKAEAQAREAQIESALEKIRSRSLAMQKSDELKEVITVVIKKLQALGMAMEGRVAGIYTFEDDSKDHVEWVASPQFTSALSIRVPYFDHPVIEEFFEFHKKRGTLNKIYSRELKDSAFRVMYQLPELRDNPESEKEWVFGAKDYSLTVAFEDHSAVGIASFPAKLFAENEVAILKRFAKVFEQSYIRFLDLKKAEKQSREVQIELALERVRARSMAMHKSGELLDVIAIVSEQLENLGFKFDIVSFAANNQKYDYSFWMTVKGQSHPYRIHVPYINNPMFENVKQAQLKGDSFYTDILTHEENKQWHQHLFEHNRLDFITDKLKKYVYNRGYARSIVLLSKIMLIVGNYSSIPYSDEENNIIKRFANVFDQVYTRFLDLQKAEAQAREAQIEVALERVRSRSLAMHKSEELNDVVMTLFDQMKNLEIDIDGININLLNDDLTGFDSWFTAPGYTKAVCLFTPYFDTPVMNDIFNAVKNKQDLFSKIYSKAEKDAYFSYLYEHSDYKNLPDERKKLILGAEGWCLSVGIANNIGISIHSYNSKTFSEKEHDILKRFAKVFNQSYRRFLDLQKAEVQAREAQIQLALERVRARTMAMQKSNELAETAHVLFQQFKEIDKEPKMITIGIMNENEGLIEFWVTDWGGGGFKVNRKFNASLNEPILLNKIYSAWKQQQKSIVIELTGKNLQDWVNYRVSLSGVPDENDYSNSCGYVIAAFFSKGILSISTYDSISDETTLILERFAGVFDGTYTRFLDLKNAEAQAREAKIEASLERVRSKAMAMHSSKDLTETMGVLFTELPMLGISSLRCGVVLLSKSSRRGVFYAAATTSESDSFTMVGAGDMAEHPVFMKQYESWLKNENYFTTLSNDSLRSYYDALFARLSIPYTPREHREQTEHGYYFSFSEGMFYAWSEEPYAEEAINILNRFKAIIDLTFRRYLDLQKAEAQAREAQIEAALERVRGKAMAMHSSEDFVATIVAFYHELAQLSFTPRRCGVGIIDKETRIAELSTLNTTDKGESIELVGKITLEGHPVLENVYKNWLIQNEYHPVLRGDEIKEYYKFIGPQIAIPDYSSDQVQYGYFFYFNEGGVYSWTEKKFSDDELQIYRRFTTVLSLTYRRYLDLKEAEARAIESVRQAALDRIRAEIASMRTSDDLNRITPIIWRELKILGVPFFRCGVYIIDETQEKVQVYLTTPDGKSLGVLNLSFDSNEMTRNTVEHWREKQVYKVHWNKEDFINWTKSMIEIGQIQNAETYQGTTEPPESLYLHFVPFAQGMLYVGDVSPLTDERLLLVKTLAGAFSIAYARYEDFRQLEEAKGAVESAFGELDILSKELKIKNEKLEIENQRKAIELEEARQLQLSMLPKKLPQLPNLQIAAFMRTATEVGGDYYDFLVQDNQVLNIGFGDATGHGLQAGTMITLIKGFFTSEAAKLEPQQFLEHCSGMIREIKLGRILMSFSLLRIMDSKLLISSAGMPPVFYYTKSEGETEEILIPGIPLGAMKRSSYKLVEKELRSGDTLLLFTDGFPEQTNSNDEMFNYTRAKNHFNNVAENSPDEIIKSLVKRADEWMNGKLQTDDITFIALKVL